MKKIYDKSKSKVKIFRNATFYETFINEIIVWYSILLLNIIIIMEEIRLFIYKNLIDNECLFLI